jgi:cobalt/nickel transport protein
MKTITKLWIGLLALVLLSPLGLILPAKFGAGSAWGEWSTEEMQKLIGYVPSGMSRLGGMWKAPIPDYAFKGQDESSLRALSISYIIAGVVGIAVVSALGILVGRVLAHRENNDST